MKRAIYTLATVLFSTCFVLFALGFYSNETYLASTFSNSIFGFIDDVEFKINAASGQIHVRSASRVGYCDWNVNRERTELIRKKIQARVAFL